MLSKRPRMEQAVNHPSHNEDFAAWARGAGDSLDHRGWTMDQIAWFSANLPPEQQRALLQLAPPEDATDPWSNRGQRRGVAAAALSRRSWDIGRRLAERSAQTPRDETRQSIVSEELWECLDLVRRATESTPTLRSQFVATDGCFLASGATSEEAVRALGEKRARVQLPALDTPYVRAPLRSAR